MTGKMVPSEFSFAATAKGLTDTEIIPMTVPMFLPASPVGTGAKEQLQSIHQPIRMSVPLSIFVTVYDIAISFSWWMSVWWMGFTYDP